MGAPNTDRLGVVRAMLETAPDTAVRNLDTALRLDTSAALGPVRAMVRAELQDRGVRDVVLAPTAPLCAPRADGFKQALFPTGVQPRLWRALRTLQPKAMTDVVTILEYAKDEDDFAPVCDGLCLAAADAIREAAPEMQDLTRYLEDFQPGAAAQFAGYLELASLARAAIRRLPQWLRSMTEENAATVRLLFKDADAIAPDASPRLLEILQAHTAEPWRVLRIIAAATHRAGDRYLASSEMAEACERVLADIDRRVNLVRQFDVDGGAPAGQAAAAAVAVALGEIHEFEGSVDLARDGPWGQRIAQAKQAVSVLAESHLKKAPKLLGEALPLQQHRAGGVTLRMEPQLDQPPDPRLVQRALASLAFFDRCRATATQGGYAGARSRAAEEIAHRLDTYIEDILALTHGGELPTLNHARAFLDVAADMTAFAQDEKSAQIVRRRAAAA